MKEKQFEIKIFEQIGSEAAVSSEDGDMLFKFISKALDEDYVVILDFCNIDIITSTFLNAAIGQLYSKYDGPFLKKHLKIRKMESEDLLLLKKVIKRAKEYFKDKEEMEKKLKKADDNE